MGELTLTGYMMSCLPKLCNIFLFFVLVYHAVDTYRVEKIALTRELSMAVLEQARIIQGSRQGGYLLHLGTDNTQLQKIYQE